jgi:hypothetical protein
MSEKISLDSSVLNYVFQQTLDFYLSDRQS